MAFSVSHLQVSQLKENLVFQAQSRLSTPDRSSHIRAWPRTFHPRPSTETQSKQLGLKSGFLSASVRVPAATAAAGSAVTAGLGTSLAGSAFEALQTPSASFFNLQPSSFFPALTDTATSVHSVDTGLLALASALLPSAGHWQQDVAATLFTLIGSVVWVKVFDELACRNLLDQKLSRKIVHITTGLLFMLSWPLFSSNPAARFLAVAVPVANAVRILLLGTGITKNEGVVKSISREGSASELLRGPLYYVLTIVLVTTIFWRSSPIGSIALVLMCGGDGMADIVGRRVGSEKLPWNSRKSWAGSIAMLLCGSLLSMLFVYIFCSFGFYHTQWWSADVCLRIFLIAAGATFMESCPISEKLDDNFTVPATAVLLGHVLLPYIA